MSWRDGFKKSFDVTYELVKDEVPDIRFPCYGGKFYWFLISRQFDNYFFYLTSNSLIYTSSGAYILKIPFNDITKITVKKGFLCKNHYHICLRADKNYHFLIYDMKDFSTTKTGNSSNNVKAFIATLIQKVNI